MDKKMMTMMMNVVSVGLMGFLLAATPPIQLSAQEAAPVCGLGERQTGTLGISSFGCGPCSQVYQDGRWIWQFDAEPMIQGVRPGGPSDGRLQADDEVVAIDGALITTAEGGRRWSTIDPGQNLAVLVRRQGIERDVHIEAGAGCVAVASDRPEQRYDYVLTRRGEGREQRTRITGMRSRAWFGFTVSWRQEGETDGESVLTVLEVDDDSPAMLAGLRSGDILTAVNHEILAEPEDVALISRALPGEALSVLIQRDGQSATVLVTPAERTPLPMRTAQSGTPPIGREGVIRRLEGIRSLQNIGQIRTELDQLLRELRGGDSLPF